MAKTSAIERNLKRARLAKRYAAKREQLKAIARNQELPVEERFAAQLKLAELPRNSAVTRIRNRCESPGVRVRSTASSVCRVSRCVTMPARV